MQDDIDIEFRAGCFPITIDAEHDDLQINWSISVL